jgi:hypothetical protein
MLFDREFPQHPGSTPLTKGIQYTPNARPGLLDVIRSVVHILFSPKKLTSQIYTAADVPLWRSTPQSMPQTYRPGDLPRHLGSDLHAHLSLPRRQCTRLSGKKKGEGRFSCMRVRCPIVLCCYLLSYPAANFILSWPTTALEFRQIQIRRS